MEANLADFSSGALMGDWDSMEPSDQLELGGEQIRVTTVASSVLSSFFDEIARVDDFGECAEQLRKLVLVDGVFAEPAVRNALFPDSQ